MASNDIPVSTDDTDPEYFSTSPVKFAVMSICTFGIYEIYWSYKNWALIKNRDRTDIMPFWRALFYPFWHYSLLKELNRTLHSPVLSSGAFRGVLATGAIVLNALVRLPDPYWLISFLTFIVFVPALVAIRARESARSAHRKNKSFHPSNLLAYFVGGPLVTYVALGVIGFFPSTLVIPGDALWDRDVNYLREAKILGQDEQIGYFYSGGAWSIAEDGQFVSEQYVTSYYQDPDTGETITNYAAYSEISDIDVLWAESFLDNTIVTITTVDDYQFQVWLSSEDGGDRKFVDLMNEYWDSASSPPQ